MAKSVWGFDDFKDRQGSWVRSWYFATNRVQYHTLSDGRWLDINKRTTKGGRYQKAKPSYVGSQNDFENFQDFVDWSIEEVGYNSVDLGGNFWSLDKDILVPGNKIYSRETCLFVPNRVNGFLILQNSVRGQLPIGVSEQKDSSKFRAECRNPYIGKSYLGMFETPQEAHRAWQSTKILVGEKMITEYLDIHPKLCEGLRTQITLIKEDYFNFRETLR